MDDSDLSSLGSSPPPPSDDDMLPDDYVPGQRSPSLSPVPSSSSSDAKNRPASPPHEYVLADNPDIAFIVMFRARFNDAFNTKLGHFGPQDIERGVMDPVPSPQVESLLCALLGLVLNRKKPIERGHYGRALEEALLAQKSQWPRAWKGQNPLSGSRTFTSMSPSEKLSLLKALILWSLHSSDIISNMIKEGYKQARGEYDLNQPLAVQPWGADGKKRIYWLIEGQDDTSFRIYTEKRQVDPQWMSIAGSIEEMQALVTKIKETDNAQAARRLADRIQRSIPRFEATEEKRKRREYRLTRRAQFVRPEPGFSLYEGRTRGKRMRYTFEEDEEEYTSDALSTRRSARASGAATPAEPTVTASGRQVRPRLGGRYGEMGVDGADSADVDTPASAEYDGSDKSEEPTAPPADANVKYYKPKGRGWKGWAIAEDTEDGAKTIHGYNEVDAMDDDDEDEAMSSGDSAGEWDGGDDESDVIKARDADDEDDDDQDLEDMSDAQPRSLMVTLKYGKRDPTHKLESSEAKQQTGIPKPQQRDSKPVAPSATSNTAPLPATNGVASSAASSPVKVETTYPTAPNTTVLASHPSPQKAAALPVKAEATDAAPVAAPLTNGSTVPPLYRQQTLDKLFGRPSSALDSEAAKPQLPSGSPLPPFTSS